MRIHEVIFRNNHPALRNRADPHLDIPPYPFDQQLSKLASAFTKDGVVKHFWYLNGLEDQPSEPAPPDAGTELIPTDNWEPAMASREADLGETEPSIGLRRLVPFRQYRGASAD